MFYLLSVVPIKVSMFSQHATQVIYFKLNFNLV